MVYRNFEKIRDRERQWSEELTNREDRFKSMASGGAHIASHTWSHPYSTPLSAPASLGHKDTSY